MDRSSDRKLLPVVLPLSDAFMNVIVAPYLLMLREASNQGSHVRTSLDWIAGD